jgi:hypothetical protein
LPVLGFLYDTDSLKHADYPVVSLITLMFVVTRGLSMGEGFLVSMIGVDFGIPPA